MYYVKCKKCGCSGALEEFIEDKKRKFDLVDIFKNNKYLRLVCPECAGKDIESVE